MNREAEVVVCSGCGLLVAVATLDSTGCPTCALLAPRDAPARHG